MSLLLQNPNAESPGAIALSAPPKWLWMGFPLLKRLGWSAEFTDSGLIYVPKATMVCLAILGQRRFLLDSIYSSGHNLVGI